MKKQTKQKKASAAAKPPRVDVLIKKPGQPPIISEAKHRGPKKEKVQISVRISKAYMDLAYAHIERTNTRITDLLERGLALAMAEEVNMPKLTQNVRFLVANTTTEQQRVIRNALVWLAIPELPDCQLTPFEELTRLLFLQAAELAERLERHDEALLLYHRYGRSAEVRGAAQLPSGQ